MKHKQLDIHIWFLKDISSGKEYMCSVRLYYGSRVLIENGQRAIYGIKKECWINGCFVPVPYDGNIWYKFDIILDKF